MTLVAHLYELRSRLAKALIGFAVGTVLGFVFFHPVFHVLRAPYCDLPISKRQGGAGCNLVFFGPLDAFALRLKVSMITGALLSSPIWLFQLWAFVTPGLHRHERRWASAFVVSATALFCLGAACAYYTLSKGLSVLLGFAGDGIQPFLEVTRYLNYVVAMILIFGISFLFPLVVVMLNLVGVLPVSRLRKWRRGAIFALFVFAAGVTPSTDPLTMLALAIPLCLLYEAAVVVARGNERRRARRAANSPDANLRDDEASAIDAPVDVEVT